MELEAPHANEKIVNKVIAHSSINLQPRMSLSFEYMIKKPKYRANQQLSL